MATNWATPRSPPLLHTSLASVHLKMKAQWFSFTVRTASSNPVRCAPAESGGERHHAGGRLSDHHGCTGNEYAEEPRGMNIPAVVLFPS